VAAVIMLAPLPAVSACTSGRQTGSVTGTVSTPWGGVSNCANCDKPVRARLLFITPGGGSTTVAHSGSRGRFYTVLCAGRYVVKVTSPSGCRMKRTVRVAANATSQLRLTCPTFIR
jgi:hypothetical protein